MVSFTQEQINACLKSNAIKHGHFYVQAHPDTGTSTWITEGIAGYVINFIEARPTGGLFLALNKQVQTEQLNKFKASKYGKRVKAMTVLSWLLALSKRFVFNWHESLKLSTENDFLRAMCNKCQLIQWINTMQPQFSEK